MTDRGTLRNKLFRAALAYRGQSMQSWSAEQGIHAGHLTRVLDGERESQRLLVPIEATVDQFLDEVCGAEKTYRRKPKRRAAA